MPDVKIYVRNAEGTGVANQKVTIKAVGDSASAVVYRNGGSTIVQPAVDHTDSNGLVTFTLDRNTDLLPTTSYYKALIPDGRKDRAVTFRVPSSGAGPFDIEDLLVDAPGTVASAALDSHALTVRNHGDVSDTAPTSGQVLIWNGSEYVPGDTVATDLEAAALVATETAARTAADTTLQTNIDAKQALSEKGQNNGYASLDSGGDVPASQLGNVPAPTAASVPFTPVGGLAADDVQEALAELDTEVVRKAGTETVTGRKTFTGGATIEDDVTNGGGARTLFRVDSQARPNAPAMLYVSSDGSFAGGSQTVYDPTITFGFLNAGGGEPSNVLIFEQDYWYDYNGVWTHSAEQHSAFITSAGAQKRVWSWQANYDGSWVDYTVAADRYTINNQASGAVAFRFIPSEKVMLMRGDVSLRFGEAATGDWYLGSQVKWDTTDARLESQGGNPAAISIRGSDGSIKFYSQGSAVAAGSVAPLAGTIINDDLTMEGDVWGKGRLKMGSNGISVVQDGFSWKFENTLTTDAGVGIGAGGTLGATSLFARTNAAGQAGIVVRTGVGSPTANMLDLQDWNDLTLSRFNKSGYFMTRKTSAPADADLATSEVAIWFDNASGAAKLKIKGKDSGGTVRTGEVVLT